MKKGAVMKGLFLYGASCTADVWALIKETMAEYDNTFVEYPHEIIQNASSITDITRWVYKTYLSSSYDFIVGHSMGGIIALELVANFGFKCERVIIIESNLKPAKEHYRNLMLPGNMKYLGPTIIPMLQSETPYYGDALKRSMQEDFDYTDYVKKIDKPVYAIYGDRGQINYENKINDLCLDEDTIKGMEFSFVKNSCHMPMIENPNELSSIITNIVSTPCHSEKRASF